MSWTPFRTEKIDPKLLAGHDFFGLSCGFENLEVIDIDNHFDDAEQLFQIIYDNFDLTKYLIAKTGGGGYHIYYKCEDIAGNKKLAQRINSKEKPETLIETRGIGGYVICPPSPGYEFIQGSYDNVPTIDHFERAELLNICKALDEIPDKEKPEITPKTGSFEGRSPIDTYHDDPSAIGETISLLRSCGWVSTDDKHWVRPGKKKGISATFGKKGKDKFYVFSTNAHPFGSGESHTMAGVKALLCHNGDFSECAKDLASRYGLVKKSSNKGVDKAAIQAVGGKWGAMFEIIEEWKLSFRYNELTNVVEYARGDGRWESPKLLYGDIIYDMEVNKNIKSVSKSKIEEMVASSSICELYNPVKNFFENLPVWNGEDHFKKLCSCIKLSPEENADYFEVMLKKHIIRTVKCASIHDYVNRMVLTFHGPQEVGKTKFFEWLVPREIFNEEVIDPTDKDSILSLSRYLMINMDDIDSLNRKEVSKLKNFISKGSITKRLAYARNDEKFERIASFVASTNKLDILSDESNTRWIILKVLSFDWKKYTKEINPAQLWAQAISEFKAGNDGELSQEEKNIRDQRNDTQFVESTSERDILERHFTSGAEKMTITDIIVAIQRHEMYYTLKLNRTQLARELKRLYGDYKNTTRDGKQGRYYLLNHDLHKKYDAPDMYPVDSNNDDVPF